MAGVLAIGCAKEGAPPGGPVDTEAPVIASVVPEPGETEVSTGQPIVFRFTEAMEERSVERALFFTPDIGPSLRVVWRGHELRLYPRVPLRENTTFVVTMGAEASDRHRNRMGRSFTLAFSTGPDLDDASLSGRVFDLGRPAPSAWVWIYPVDDSDLSDLADPAFAALDPPASIPLYITQADAEGRWEMTHMARGTYRVFAYRDSDNRQGYAPDRDLLAIPGTDLLLQARDSSFEEVNLSVAARDTVGPRIRSATAPNRDFVQVRFSEPTSLDPLPRVSLEPLTADGVRDPSRAAPRVLRAYSPIGSPSTLVARVEGFQGGGRYRVRLLDARDLMGNPGTEGISPVTFNVPTTADTTGLRIVSVAPADSTRALDTDSSVHIRFSTEIDTTGLGPFRLAGPDTLETESVWLDARTLRLRPLSDATADALYRLRIPRGSLRSWNGTNGPDREAVFTWRGRPLPDRGSLRITVEGPPMEGPGRYLLILEGVGPSTPPRVVMSVRLAGSVTTAPLPPGPYLLWGFADADGDGVPFPGRVRPFLPAEFVSAVSDTLYVREAFESVLDSPIYLGPPRMREKR